MSNAAPPADARAACVARAWPTRDAPTLWVNANHTLHVAA